MGFIEEDFLAIAAGKYGRELLKRYRKSLRLLVPTDAPTLPKHDQITSYSRTLFQQLSRGDYYPSPPLEYVVLNKHQGVPRILPIFSFADALVYYFCVFSIQDELANGRVEGTFGGWSSSNSIRRLELASTSDEPEDTSTYSPYASVNRRAWSEHWREFQREAFAVSKDGSNPFVVKYEIANFYDSVNLNHLERKLRHRCGTKHHEVIDLLMSFLRTWNRRIEGYSPKQVGLPMDVEGEASRLLANFYLQEHDAALLEYVGTTLGGKYLRYADDIMILTSTAVDRNSGFVKSGIDLHRIGLSVNSGKVVTFDGLEGYDYYWSFDLFDMIGDGKDGISANCAAQLYFNRMENAELAQHQPWRSNSVLKRLLTIGPHTLNKENARRLARSAMDSDPLSTMNEFQLRRIHSMLPYDERPSLIQKLSSMVEESFHTQQLLHIRSFFSSISPSVSFQRVDQRINELREFYGFSSPRSVIADPMPPVGAGGQ